jgi:hypothetical protein
MQPITHDPQPVAFSIRLYQALLRIYPPAFRREYGWLMAQVFGDCCRRAFQHAGFTGLLPLWARTTLDTLATAIEEHTQRGTDMSKEKFIKLSGWAFVLGGLSFFIGWLAGNRPEYQPHNYYSLEIDRVANAVSAPLILAALLLISVGLLGLAVRFGQASSGIGRACLVVGAASGLVAFSAWGLELTGLQIPEDTAWYLFIYSMTIMFAGLGIWGVECLRRRMMARANVLPLLAGIVMPIFILTASIYEAFAGRWVALPDLVNLALFAIIAASLVGLGFQLQAESASQPSLSAAH